MTHPGRAWLLAVWMAHMVAVAAVAGDWPAFRGPDGNGVARDDKAPLHWAPEKNVRWKAPLPGPGNSSPIVSRGRVFVTCAEEAGKKRNLYCFDRRTGDLLWMRTVSFPAVEPTHKTNPYCASTPVADGSRVVVWHGSAGVFCYDFDGKELWKKDLGAARHEWGYASSPILHDGKVILNFGPGARTFLAALDLKTGQLLWQHDEPGGLDATDKRMVGSWSTPIVANVNGRDQILCSMPTRVIACDPATGSLRWSCGGLADDKADLVYASPLVSGDLGVAFTGWVNGPTIGFKLGGSGDVTATNRLWLQKQPQRIGSGMVVDVLGHNANAPLLVARNLEREHHVRHGKRVFEKVSVHRAIFGAPVHLAAGNCKLLFEKVGSAISDAVYHRLRATAVVVDLRTRAVEEAVLIQEL